MTFSSEELEEFKLHEWHRLNPRRELVDPVTHTGLLTKCQNGLCVRLKLRGLAYCCGDCSLAHERGEIEHTESCGWRWDQRKHLLA